MNFLSPNLDIFSCESTDPDLAKSCLRFKFKGKFTTEASALGTQAWSKEFEANPEAQYILIWDCLEMDGFEINARKQWYVAMSKYKKRIAKVYILSDGLMIRSAAKVMMEFFGIKSKICSSEAELFHPVK